MTICQHMDGVSSLVPAFWITAAGQVQPFLSTDLFSLCGPSNPLTPLKTLSSHTLTLTFLGLLGGRSCRATTSSSARV